MRDLTGGFTADQVRRYSRHVLLPDLGGAGQARLLAATVEVEIGGAAARVAALYLVAAGVGTVRLRGDLDRLLARGEVQFPLAAADLGRPLGAALFAALAGHNGDVTVSGCRTDDTAPDAVLAIAGDAHHLPLPLAMMRGGEAAARLVYRLAAGRP